MTQRILPKATATQWAVLTLLFLWGFASFLVMAGEESPSDPPMTLGKFLLIKGVALASFGLCLLVGKYLNRKGLLPDVKDE